MKTWKDLQISIPLLRASALVLGAACLAGCQSTGYQKGQQAAVSMQSAAGEVQAESRALELTIGSLKDLVETPSPDLRPQFDRFSRSLDRLVACARRSESTGANMARKSAAYFATWDKQAALINYQALRDSSIAREAEVKTQLEAVQRRYQDTHAVVEPLIAYLQDIRTMLSADLTPGGLAAARRSVNNASQNADKVQASLGALVTALGESSNRVLPAIATTAGQQTPAARAELPATGR